MDFIVFIEFDFCLKIIFEMNHICHDSSDKLPKQIESLLLSHPLCR